MRPNAPTAGSARPVTDILPGYDPAVGGERVERDYFIRQLRDWKGSAPEEGTPATMNIYGDARVCGRTGRTCHCRGRTVTDSGRSLSAVANRVFGAGGPLRAGWGNGVPA